MELTFICTSVAIANEYNMKRLKVQLLVSGYLWLIGFMGPALDIEALWFIAVVGCGLGIPIVYIEFICLYKKMGNSNRGWAWY